MTEYAYLNYMSCRATDEEVIEFYNDSITWLRMYEAGEIDFDAGYPEDPYETYKVQEWHQAVLHAEIKARAGREPRLLLYWLTGINTFELRGAGYTSFIPEFWWCACCKRPLLLNVDGPYESTLEHLCRQCSKAHHQPRITECDYKLPK